MNNRNRELAFQQPDFQARWYPGQEHSWAAHTCD